MNISRRGLIGTSVFHSIVFLLIAFFGFKTPLPLPAEQGILVNFGDSEFGMGSEEPMVNEVPKKEKSLPITENTEKSKPRVSIMTQDFEEAPAVASDNKPKKKEPEKKKEKPTPQTKQPVAKVKQPVEETPAVNPQALYRGRKTGTSYTGSEGIAGGKGNQGSLSGSVNATDHSLGGGFGGGISASLIGRQSLSLPKPEYDFQKEGKVVVEIKVDRNGNVVSAVPGVKGSTTLDSYLCSMAKKAAMDSKFDINSDAPLNQVGTISYIFKLK
jgi:outer membrane biosynthesis protein TonB